MKPTTERFVFFFNNITSKDYLMNRREFIKTGAFATAAAFSKAFKKHFGSSPIRYVNALKRNEPAVDIPSADRIIKN